MRILSVHNHIRLEEKMSPVSLKRLLRVIWLKCMGKQPACRTEPNAWLLIQFWSEAYKQLENTGAAS